MSILPLDQGVQHSDAGALFFCRSYELLQLGLEIRRHPQKFNHELLNLVAGKGANFQLSLFRLGQKLLIRHSLHKGRFQRRTALRRNAWRQSIRLSEIVRDACPEAEELALLFVPGHRGDCRDIRKGKVFDRAVSQLREDQPFAAFELVQRCDLRRCPGIEEPLHLSAIDGHPDIGGPFVARYHFEISPQHIPHQYRPVLYSGTGDCADHNLLTLGSQGLLNLCYPRFSGHNHQVGLADWNSEIAKLANVELYRRIVKELLQDDWPRDVAYHGPIFGRGVIDVICRDDTAGAGHVVDDDRGVPRNVLAEMACDHTRIRIISATG